MRFTSLGSDEAVVWERHVLAVHDPRYDPATDADASAASVSSTATADGQKQAETFEGDSPVNAQLVRWGLAREFARDAVNPGFACPFPASSTITLDNPLYRFFGVSFMRGKLDWVLLRRMKTVHTEIGNEDYALSDHKWLLAEVEFEKT